MKKTKCFKLPKKYKCYLFLLFITVFVFFIFGFINNVINPIIVETTAAQTRSLSQKAVESAVWEIIQDNNIYDNLVDITLDHSGKVSYLSTNSLEINKLARKLSQLSETNISAMGEIGIDIPIGTFTGMPIFVGRGFDINLKILPIGSIGVQFSSTFTSAGINQTIHRIYVSIVSSVSIILPTANQTVETISEILIAESIVVGDIPNSYLTTNDSELLWNLVP